MPGSSEPPTDETPAPAGVRGIGIPALMSLLKGVDMFGTDLPDTATFRDWAAATGERPIAWEARCNKCGESFNPSGDEALHVDANGDALVEHYGTELEECGGFGPIVGSWS